MAQARRLCSVASPSRRPNRTALGTVRDSASTTGPASTPEAADNQPGPSPRGGGGEGAEQHHHHDRDQPAHRLRCGGRPVVVRRDRGQHRFGELLAAVPMPGALGVEDQVHPQHREQKSAARQHQTGRHRHRASHDPPSAPPRGHEDTVPLDEDPDRSTVEIVLRAERLRTADHHGGPETTTAPATTGNRRGHRNSRRRTIPAVEDLVIATGRHRGRTTVRERRGPVEPLHRQLQPAAARSPHPWGGAGRRRDIACRHIPVCISYYVNYPGQLIVPGADAQTDQTVSVRTPPGCRPVALRPPRAPR